MTDQEINKEILKIIMRAFQVLIQSEPRLKEDDWNVVYTATTIVGMELLSMEEETVYEH
jgi:GTP-sensing pleiotropic transcriptional regulator CodY